MHSFRVAIPSYGRPELCAKTIDNLVKHGIVAPSITVFLSDWEESTAYRMAIKHVVKLEKGGPGIVGNRNVIYRYYAEGQRVLSIDDDITEILILGTTTEGKNVLMAPGPLDVLFESCFDMAGCDLWGINPTGNPFYMRPKTRHGLIFAIGCLHGYTTRHSLPDLEIETKEDYERTVHFYEHDGLVARYDWLTTNNKYARTPGGLGTDRDDRNLAAVAALCSRWPEYFMEKSPTEVKLRKL